MAIGIALGACSKPSGSPATSPAMPAVENRTDPELKRFVEQLVLVLKSGRLEDFLNYVSKDGVCIGTDCELTPLKEIKADIRSKKGSYCELFDSSCLHRQLQARWTKAKEEEIAEVLSFRDMFKTSAGRDVEIENVGRAHIRVHYKEFGSGGKYGFRPEEMDFGLAKEDGAWKLTAMSAY